METKEGDIVTYQINLKLIKSKREEHHYSMQQMSEMLGLSGKSDYFKRENGDVKFKSVELPILAKALEIPLEDFFTPNVEKIETKR